MSDNQKQELGSNVINQLLKDQLSRRNEQDNSFAFLEKSTLHQLMAYLLSGEKKNTGQNDNPELEAKLMKQLDEILEDSKAQFEEVVDLLKSYSG
jgi:hypothetical protein